jgi:hypothetical protein
VTDSPASIDAPETILHPSTTTARAFRFLTVNSNSPVDPCIANQNVGTNLKIEMAEK